MCETHLLIESQLPARQMSFRWFAVHEAIFNWKRNQPNLLRALSDRLDMDYTDHREIFILILQYSIGSICR